MKSETFEKLKASSAVLKIRADQMLYILTNADGHEKPKLYSFLHNDGKPLVNEITEESVMLNITGDRNNKS